ncbi:MAG: DNA repair protein RadC [Candidatus Omnitrophica bacterium]|nr:DNA repair protein RadC [Candidatus Omnitrophota bacterium]MCF7888169.1 DNA repair protein RadC [Candidatus Omnitrophota bacterium]
MTRSFTLHDLPKEERPRERLIKFGEQALSAQELLQLILGRGVPGESVTVTAQKILSHFGSLQKLAEASIEELSQIKGIGSAKAAQIRAACEMGRRISTQTPSYKSKELTNPEKVFKFMRSRVKDYKKEHLYVIVLNTKSWTVGEISLGTLDTMLAHPREAFAEAIKHNASSVIFVHNHPSGNAEPSQEDIELTKQLIKAGELLRIEVLDHLVITKENFCSIIKKLK